MHHHAANTQGHEDDDEKTWEGVEKSTHFKGGETLTSFYIFVAIFIY